MYIDIPSIIDMKRDLSARIIVVAVAAAASRSNSLIVCSPQAHSRAARLVILLFSSPAIVFRGHLWKFIKTNADRIEQGSPDSKRAAPFILREPQSGAFFSWGLSLLLSYFSLFSPSELRFGSMLSIIRA